MTLFTQNIAWFFNAKGEMVGKKKFNPLKHSTIEWNEKMYNVDEKNGSDATFTIIPLILERRRWFYNTDFSNPYNFRAYTKKELQELLDQSNKNDKNEPFIVPPISPELYNINMKTKLAKDLGDLASGSIFKWLKEHPAVIFLGLVGLVAIIYFASGHKLA